MQKSNHILLAALFAFLFISTDFFAQNFDKKDWKLKTKKDNLKVYTRKSVDSDIKEIRIQASLNASKERILEVLNDVSNYTDWVFKSVETKKIKIISDTEYYYYSKSDFPFPLADRDLVLYTQQWTDEKTGFIYSRSQASPVDLMDEKKGVVRIKLFDSYWKIMPQKNGTVEVDYVALAHPGGKLPAWVINLGVVKGPLETMKRFTEHVEQTSSKTVLSNVND